MKGRRRRGALIGYGFIAEHGHLPAYRSSDALELVAVADLCPARCAAAARALPGARIYGDAAELFVREGEALDFVDITTPPYAHAAIARQALECGLHVLCEKPLTTDSTQARALLAFAAHQRCVLFPSHNYKQAPVIRRVNEIVSSDVIGPVHHVTMETFRPSHARGVVEWNEHWRTQRCFSGGGITMDHGSHSFYLAFDWLRSYPSSVTAKTASDAEADTEHTLAATLTFPTGLACVHLTWRAGVRKVVYTLHGSRGALRVDDDELELSVKESGVRSPATRADTWSVQRQRIASHWVDAGHSAWFPSLLSRFAAAIDAREHVGKDALDALACVQLIESAYASAAARSLEQACPAIASP